MDVGWDVCSQKMTAREGPSGPCGQERCTSGLSNLVKIKFILSYIIKTYPVLRCNGHRHTQIYAESVAKLLGI